MKLFRKGSHMPYIAFN